LSNKAVVILNYNGKQHLENYLSNIIDNTSSEAEIIIIDNASTDDSLEYLQTNFAQIRTIVLDKNYGFAGGYNEGLKHVTQEYLVLLNSDIEVTQNWDSAIWNTLEDPSIGAVQPRILDLKDKDKYEYAGAGGGYVDKYYFPFCRGRIFSELESKDTHFEYSDKMFWASGAAFGIRKNVYDTLAGFDVDFFAHMEEIDLCYRLQNHGFKIAYNPESTVYHLGGGTLNMMSPFKTYLNYRNGLTLILKNHFHSPIIPVLFIRLTLDGMSAVNFLLRMMPSHTLAILKGHISFYKNLGSNLKKRRALKEISKKTTPNGMYQKSIVSAYFIGKVKKFSQLDSQDFSN
jgi:GT2 family glycosyltransferase